MRQLMWWVVFCVTGIWLQSLFPGIDFLLVGLIVSLQEEKWLTAAWLCPFFIIIQEGAGSLAFGSSVLWYAGAVVAFFLGRALFDLHNYLFYGLFSLFLGVWFGLVLFVMTKLQDVHLGLESILVRGGVTTLVFPVLLVIVHRLHTLAAPPSRSHV